jgi:hypothetical protein
LNRFTISNSQRLITKRRKGNHHFPTWLLPLPGPSKRPSWPVSRGCGTYPDQTFNRFAAVLRVRLKSYANAPAKWRASASAGSAMCSRGIAVRFCLGGIIADAVPPELRCKLRDEHVSVSLPYRECGIQACFVENDSKPISTSMHSACGSNRSSCLYSDED